jgi:hypothetical protein
MEKEFVPYEVALRLKVLGFKEKCLASFYTYDIENFKENKFDYRGKFNIDYSSEDDYIINTDKSYYIAAPTFYQAFRWFREKYDLFPIVQPYFPSNRLTWNIIFMDNFSINVGDGDGEYVESEIIGSYEEAEIACLKKMIEIVKEKL